MLPQCVTNLLERQGESEDLGYTLHGEAFVCIAQTVHITAIQRHRETKFLGVHTGERGNIIRDYARSDARRDGGLNGF